MIIGQTEDEILEQQRKDSTNAYAKRVIEIKNEIDNYEGKLSNLKELFNIEYEKKLDEVKNLENDLRLKLAEADNNNSLIKSCLKEAQIKLDNANALESSLVDKHNDHAENVEIHLSTIDGRKEDIRQRDSISIEKENQANTIMVEANNRLNDAIKKENKIEEEANRLSHILNNVDQDIAIQKDLYNKNSLLLKEIDNNKNELLEIKDKSEKDKKEAVKIRDDVDAFQARLAKRKDELDQTAKDLSAAQIRLDVATQSLKDKEQYIDNQISKLNQLKSDVEILLKQKEAKEA